MNLKNITLSTEIEYYQEIQILKEKNSKSISKTLLLSSKLILLILGFFVFICRALGFLVVAYQYCVPL